MRKISVPLVLALLLLFPRSFMPKASISPEPGRWTGSIRPWTRETGGRRGQVAEREEAEMRTMNMEQAFATFLRRRPLL